MDDTNLQETTVRLDAKIDALAAEMRAGFNNAFQQTQSGVNDAHAFAEFVAKRSETAIRTNMNARFAGMNTRFDEVDARLGRIDGRFDGLENRFDRIEELIKER